MTFDTPFGFARFIHLPCWIGPNGYLFIISDDWQKYNHHQWVSGVV